MELTYLQIAGLLSLWVLLGFVGNFISGWASNYAIWGIHQVTTNWLYMFTWIFGPITIISSLFFAIPKIGKPGYGTYSFNDRVVWRWWYEDI